MKRHRPTRRETGEAARQRRKGDAWLLFFESSPQQRDFLK
jgi:hypothetical protein